MGKAAKAVVGIAVSIAIPFVAPKIVGALAASSMVSGTALGAALGTTVGATAGSALVGAGLGAVNAKLTGGDVGRGALFGAIGGGVGGYAGAQSAVQQSALTAANATADPIAALNASQGWTASNPAYLSSIGYTGPIVTPAAGGGTTSVQGTQPQGGVSGTAQTPGATQSLSFTDALKAVPGELAAKFSDPKTLADLTLRAGASLLTGQMAGDGLSPEEQQLLQAQMADLSSLREQDEELFKTRLREAMGLLGEARYFDPNQFGIQAQNAVKVAGAQQMREVERQAALRPGTGGMSDADRRRAGLDITARGQTAYVQGAESAQKQRLATYQAGLAALPTQGPTAGLNYSKNLMDMYGEADKRKRQVQEDIGGWFGSLTGSNTSKSIG